MRPAAQAGGAKSMWEAEAPRHSRDCLRALPREGARESDEAGLGAVGADGVVR